jgi:DNA-binding CsgD family transcriptional regulator
VYLLKYLTVLTREEKERFVLDLYNQGKSTREIAEEARMSFRDIGVILDKAEDEKEASKEQAEKVSQSTQAYKLFSEGKSPVQVAIALNIREPEVARFYVESWKLRQLYSLYKIYEETKDGIGPFVNLYTLAKVARMGVKQVVRVLEIANNDLPLVEHKYERSKGDLDSIEAEIQNSARILQEISDQIATMRKTLDQYQLSCKEERLELTKIQLQKVRLEGLVDNFQNNDQGYVKIRDTAEEKVISIL